ncbi:hypothetical protein ATO13_22571 [Stappia sp. 22II-S9-Z10]|nr:hypothetical protein ATO13_22571 [Stappia sp. 22II-S9-Z10]
MPSPILSDDRVSTASYLVSEANGFRSREQVLIASGSGVLMPGAVLGRVTASGKYAPLDPDAETGEEDAVAILYEGCDATDADVRRAITARDSEVVAELLVFADGTTDPEKTAALAQLAALGIIAR